jgi:hypothetical protein
LLNFLFKTLLTPLLLDIGGGGGAFFFPIGGGGTLLLMVVLELLTLSTPFISPLLTVSLFALLFIELILLLF